MRVACGRISPIPFLYRDKDETIMSEHMTVKELSDEIWYWYLIGENKVGFPKSFSRMLRNMQVVYNLLPGTPRCIECNVPLGGAGTLVAGPILGLRPSMLTPRLCDGCEKHILENDGGAEVELTLLFADIRGSTIMSEQKAALEYKDFIGRFYKTASQVLIEHNALVSRLMGDQVIGLFAPRFAGSKHSGVAIETALEILRATGHSDPQGPWAPVGVGIHTGRAYVGAVGSRDGVREIAVLGSAANLTARLSSKAAQGEVLISEEAAASANLADRTLEKRRLKLKGINKPATVRVMQVSAGKL
jgi:adenylate cyclase